MKRILFIFPFFIILSLLSIQKAFSHSGRTNSSGCHNNRKTGGYHCHNGGYVAPPIYQKPEINKPKINPPVYQEKNNTFSIKEKINSPIENIWEKEKEIWFDDEKFKTYLYEEFDFRIPKSSISKLNIDQAKVGACYAFIEFESFPNKIIKQDCKNLYEKYKNNNAFTFSQSFLVFAIDKQVEDRYKSKYPKVKIEKCYDGDTCTSSDGEKIRLACIDAPELKDDDTENIEGNLSRIYLNKLISGKILEIKRLDIDRYGRTVAELFFEDKNIQKLIVDNGFGIIYKEYSEQCKWAKEY
tara:strand:- start:458 stop:1351 length:894 start_codon:yes stop_codon:yes gene_type:complete